MNRPLDHRFFAYPQIKLSSRVLQPDNKLLVQRLDYNSDQIGRTGVVDKGYFTRQCIQPMPGYRMGLGLYAAQKQPPAGP